MLSKSTYITILQGLIINADLNSNSIDEFYKCRFIIWILGHWGYRRWWIHSPLFPFERALKYWWLGPTHRNSNLIYLSVAWAKKKKWCYKEFSNIKECLCFNDRWRKQNIYYLFSVILIIFLKHVYNNHFLKAPRQFLMGGRCWEVVFSIKLDFMVNVTNTFLELSIPGYEMEILPLGWKDRLSIKTGTCMWPLYPNIH